MTRKDPKFAQELRDKIKKWDDSWKVNRNQFHDWMSFVLGDMWEEKESELFTRYNKIPLTMNKLAPLASYMLGEQRQNTPSLQVTPDKSVSSEFVEVREALIKNIAFESEAKLAYQTAFQCAIIGGYGAYSIGTDYEDNSFDQNICIYAIKDPTRCYWDCSAESPSKTDGMYAGWKTRVSRKKFQGMYGEKIERQIAASSYTDDTSLMNFNDDDSITIIDHYEREYETFTLYKLSNGLTVTKKEMDMMDRIEVEGREIIMLNSEGVNVEDKREAYRYKVLHYKVAGDFILEKNEFPSEQLPIVFVDQNSYWDKNSRQICRPFFKDAKDAQRFINYLATQIAYLIKVSRFDQFMASKQNVKSADTQQMWQDPATAQGCLWYDESPNGNKPERIHPPELSQSLTIQYERALHDIQSCTGIYDTQIGQKGGEISGAAVDARTKRGSYNTYVPYDALNRAIATGGQIIEEMIPRVYDTERLLMLRMSDQMLEAVEINKPTDDYGEQIKNDMTKGRFKVRLLPGPSYEGQKQEALESLQLVLQANPQLFNMIADLYAENLPLSNNIELRNRLRTIVPQEIIEAGKHGKPLPSKPKQPPPELLIKMKEQELQEQDLKLRIQESQFKAKATMQELTLKQKELETRVNHDSQRVSMEWQKLEAEKLEAAAKLEEQEMRFRAEMARIQADADISHADNLAKLLIHQTKKPEGRTHDNA